MLSLVLRALRARRAQSLAMFVLALLAALGTAAAPWFLAWGLDAVARANVVSSPISERLLMVSGTAQYDPGAGSPVQLLRDRVAQALPVPGVQSEAGARALVSVTAPAAGQAPAEAESLDVYLVSRDGVCERVTLVDGVCPGADGEALLPRRVAQVLEVGVGDRLSATSFRLRAAVPLVVSGIYDVTDPFDVYWAGTQLLPPPDSADDATHAPVLVSEPTLLGALPTSVDVDLHMLLPDSAFSEAGVDLRRMIRSASSDFLVDGFTLTTSARDLVARIENDRRLVILGVSVGAGQLTLVCWVGLFLAVRHTSEERRTDIGLLKLRGASTRRAWVLAGLSSGVPMLAGTVVGVVLGVAAAAGLAGSSAATGAGGGGVLDVIRTTSLDPLVALALSLAAAAVAALGGFIAAVAAEWRTIRTPVVDLLRRIPARRRGWRADVADLVVVVLAVAGVYQGSVEARAGDEPGALALLAPALVGLASALVVARTVPPLASTVGGAALRAGRAGVALAALQLARRPGMHRVFAVLAVAGAVFTTTTVIWHSASRAWNQRAVQELGADRVLTVEASGAPALLAAVRAVDPEGRYAMAVATTSGSVTSDRVIAIDTVRYARVGRMPDGLPSAADLVPLLRPTAPEPPTVVDGRLTLDVTVPEQSLAAGEVGLAVHLATVDGQRVDVEYPGPTAGRQSLETEVTGCAPSCRLVSIEVVVPPDVRASTAVTVELHELRQPGGSVASAETLGDVTRWRGSLASGTAPPVLAATDGRLMIVVPQGSPPPSMVADGRVMPIGAPAPLPIVLAGPGIRQAGGDMRVSALGGAYVPFRVAARIAAVPGFGAEGVLVDLDYALRSNDAPTEAVDLSVWLTADAPDSLVAALAGHGVTVLGEASVAERTADLGRFGPGLALRFEYFAALIVLLLAAGVAVVGSTVDRGGRVAELSALRGQGLDARAVRVAGYAGTAGLVALATVTGVVAALLAQAVVSAGLPIFSDTWRLLPVPAGVTPMTLLLSAAALLLVVGGVALWGSARLVRAASGRVGGGDAP